jgi:hypothetical protein
MRKLLPVAFGCLLLSIPLVGYVQQAPGEAFDQEDGMERLQDLLKAQTEALKALRDRVEKLETRLKKLEDARPAGDGR